VIRDFFAKSQIRKLELRPGDIVLIRFRGTPGPDVMTAQRDFFAAKLPDGVSAILMDDSTTLEVLRPSVAS
jgi:hypothetical protein